MEHEIIKVGLDKLVQRISQTGQCICTYTKADDVCCCAAKFSINEADRALAVAEVKRRHQVIKRRGQNWRGVLGVLTIAAAAIAAAAAAATANA